MLWATASGMNFYKDGKPTYPRWHELINPKKDDPKQYFTKKDVKNYLRRLKNKK